MPITSLISYSLLWQPALYSRYCLISKICIFVCLINTGCVQADNHSIFASKPKHAQRIIALAPHLVESLYAIGAGDRIIATLEHADYPKQAQSIPIVGNYHGVQIEKILALNPDLILVWKNGNKATDIAQLERLNLPLYYSDSSQIEAIFDELITLGKLTGLTKKAQTLAQEYKLKLNQLRGQYQHKAPISVFYQLWSEPLMTINNTTWLNQIIDLCGGTNAFAFNTTAYPQISIENVLRAQPQVIVMPEKTTEQRQPIADWNKWVDIPAVKYQQYIRVNADLIHRFSPRMLEGVQQLCEGLDDSRTFFNPNKTLLDSNKTYRKKLSSFKHSI